MASSPLEVHSHAEMREIVFASAGEEAPIARHFMQEEEAEGREDAWEDRPAFFWRGLEDYW